MVDLFEFVGPAPLSLKVDKNCVWRRQAVGHLSRISCASGTLHIQMRTRGGGDQKTQTRMDWPLLGHI